MFCHKGKHTTNQLFEVPKAIGKFKRQCLECSSSSLREQDKSAKLIKNQKTRRDAMLLEPALCYSM